MLRCVRLSRVAETETEQPFLFLALDLPPPPLFQDEMEANIIPQVPLNELLAKFIGASKTVRLMR